MSKRLLNFSRCLSAVITMLCSADLMATQNRIVWASVDRFEPIHAIKKSPTSDTSCSHLPPRQAGLAALVAWDLRPDCGLEKSIEIEGYRVYYSWNGKEYHHTMSQPPGRRIRLRVQLDHDD